MTISAKIAKLRGSAGSGKTAELMSVMEAARAGLGGSPFSIGFASLTRAARQEAAERASEAWGVPTSLLTRDGWFRTAHSVAYRMLGVSGGQLLTAEPESQRWVAEALRSHVRVQVDADRGYRLFAGDEDAAMAMSIWDYARSRLMPVRAVVSSMLRSGHQPPALATTLRYIRMYEDAKRRDGRVDFADLLARYSGVAFGVDGPVDVEPQGDLPEEVRAWVFDEHQDATALLDRVCRRLASGPNVRWVYLAGDEFQSIYGFGGSDSGLFLAWDAAKERVQKKSWRCPRPIIELGERCLRRMHSGYWDRGVEPADHEGQIGRIYGIERSVDAVNAAESTLVLARCNHTLDSWEDVLARKGLPYARLGKNEEEAERSRRGMRALWNLEHGIPANGTHFADAAAILPPRYMVKGSRRRWADEDTLASWNVVFPSDMDRAGLTPDMIARVQAGKWHEVVQGGDRWRKSAMKHGPELATEPTIRVATIHGSKGLEADTVVLSTTSSRRVQEVQELDRAQHDEERRLEYVAVTRTRRRLIVSEDPEARWRLDIPA